MKRIIKLAIVVSLGILMLGFSIIAGAETVDIDTILAQIDAYSNFGGTDFAAVMTMITEDPEKGLEKTVVRQFRRDTGDMFLLLIQEPAVQRGQGYLLEGDNLWFYDPSSRKFAHTSMKESFQGTDARNSDFSRWTYAQDYTVAQYSEGMLGRFEVLIIELVAIHDTVTYPFTTLWVTKDTSLVLKTEDYSLTRRLMRTSLYPNYARIGGHVTPTQMIFIDELVEGKKTQITLSEISINPLPDHVFTKAYIERVNR